MKKGDWWASLAPPGLSLALSPGLSILNQLRLVHGVNDMPEVFGFTSECIAGFPVPGIEIKRPTFECSLFLPIGPGNCGKIQWLERFRKLQSLCKEWWPKGRAFTIAGTTSFAFSIIREIVKGKAALIYEIRSQELIRRYIYGIILRVLCQS